MEAEVYICEACKLDGAVREAKYYCPDCKDYMCDSCETYHRKVKVTRQHALLSKEDMPKRQGVMSRTKAEGASAEPGPSTAVEHESWFEDSTPAEDDFDWETTEAEEFTARNDMPTSAEEFLKANTARKKLFLNAKLTPHTSVNIVNIKHVSDKYEPLVTGLSFLPSGELLVADYNNKYLKLLNKSLKIKQTLECPGIPYGVAILNEKEAVVTFPLQRNVVQFVKLYPVLQLGKSVQMNNGCWGVTVSKNKIYIACNANGHREEVMILDMSGNILKTIDIAKLVDQFGDLKHIAANSHGDRLYLTGSSKVLCMTPDGDKIFTCSSAAFGGPRGIVVDDGNNALVCCHGTNKVMIIKSDGRKSRALLTSKDGIQDPKAIAYRQGDGLLVIGGWKKYNLLVFRII